MYCVIINPDTVQVKRDDGRIANTFHPGCQGDRIDSAYMSGDDKVVINYTDTYNRHHVKLYTVEGRILRHDWN